MAAYYPSPSSFLACFCCYSPMLGVGLTARSTYDDNMNCSMVLYSGSLNSAISLFFRWFHTEESYDVLTLTDGIRGGGQPIAVLSGTQPAGELFTSCGPYLHLTFTSDSSVRFSGFTAVATCAYDEYCPLYLCCHAVTL